MKLLNSNEAKDYLEISNWKLKKLVEEGRLTPQIVKSKFNYKKGAYLYNVFQLVKVKKELKKEGYKYRYA